MYSALLRSMKTLISQPNAKSNAISDMQPSKVFEKVLEISDELVV